VALMPKMINAIPTAKRAMPTALFMILSFVLAEE
jgi:hypothetical protein